MKVILSVPYEGYSRNASCVLNYISTLLLELYLFRICQVTFHFYTFNFYFNKLVPIIEIRGPLESVSLIWFADKYQYLLVLSFFTTDSNVLVSPYKTLH